MKMLSLTLLLLLLTASAALGYGSIHLQSGNGYSGGPDSSVKVVGAYLANPGFSSDVPLHNAYVTDTLSSWTDVGINAQWVSTDVSGWGPRGGYKYYTTFTLPSTVASATILVSFRADDVVYPLLNGIDFTGFSQVGGGPGSSGIFTPASYQVDISNLVHPGENELSFMVANVAGANVGNNPTGLQFQANISYTTETRGVITAFTSGASAFGASGGTGTIGVAATGSWRASTGDSWIKLPGSSFSGNCNIVYNVSSNPTGSARTGTIAIGDKIFVVRQAKGDFADNLDTSSWAQPFVNAIYAHGITVGCGNNNYCGGDYVTREQMAAFIIRAKFTDSFTLDTMTPHFEDVPSSTPIYFRYIQKMWETGLAAPNQKYNPSSTVTREQMAAFIIRALNGESFTYDQHPYFTDVPSTSIFFKYVQKLKEAGITVSNGTYRPSDPVTRNEMATFLARAFLGMTPRYFVDMNAAPVANAGANQSAFKGAKVTLDGSGSSDAKGYPLSYSWAFTSIPAGSLAALSNPTTVSPSFVPDVVGTYVLSLIVNDGNKDSAASAVTINVSRGNTAPVARAGTTQNVATGTLVTLDGTASRDADGDRLTYKWAIASKPTGSTASLSSPTAGKPTFTADAAGAYVINLIVNDGAVDSAVSSTTVNAIKSKASPPPPLSQAVAYQIDYAHSGYSSFSPAVTFPSSPAWSTTLNGAVSYPLIADGKVFVTTSRIGSSDGYGTSLYALDEHTGAVVWGPIAISGTYYWSGHAYDHGNLFVVNFDGLLQSFDAATGLPGWITKLPGQYAFSSPPTAVNGIVYVGGAGVGGTLYAVDESSGAVLWTSDVQNGDNSSPTVSSDGVFVSYPCQVYKFDPLTGASLWHYAGGCEGGGGKTSVYANGSLYVRDTSDLVFNAATGALNGSFAATPAPAFSSKYGFFQTSGTLTGIDLATKAPLWRFTGDGRLVSAPIAINEYVLVGSSSGNVYALDAATGSLVWGGTAAAGIPAPDEQNVSQPLTGLGAGEGYLVVPAGDTVTAWSLAGP